MSKNPSESTVIFLWHCYCRMLYVCEFINALSYFRVRFNSLQDQYNFPVGAVQCLGHTLSYTFFMSYLLTLYPLCNIYIYLYIHICFADCSGSILNGKTRCAARNSEPQCTEMIQGPHSSPPLQHTHTHTHSEPPIQHGAAGKKSESDLKIKAEINVFCRGCSKESDTHSYPIEVINNQIFI